MSPRTILQQAAVDGDFRAELLTDPDVFGVTPESLPAAVAEPDQESLDFWTEGVAAGEVFACVTSCSFGPITAICDGTTK